MATDRDAVKVNRVVAYKAIQEFDGPNGRHYEVGDVVDVGAWSKKVVQSSLNYVIELVEEV